MELTPKLLTEDVDFRRAYRGYDPDEVDDFLERVAVAVGQLQSQLAEAVERARAAEGRVQQAQRDAEDARRQAAQVAQSAPLTAAAPAPAPVPVAVDPAAAAAAAREADDLNEELRRTLVLAQRTADAAIREAREQAMKITGEADERAQRRLVDAEAEARRKSDEARSKLLAEIAELEGIRESFRGDVTVLERHLEEQRLQLRSTLQELQRLLDDPGSFRVEPVPPLSGVSAPRSAAELPPARPVRAAAPPAAAPAPRPSGPPQAARPAMASPPAGSQGPPSGEVTFRGATPAGAAAAPDAGPRTQPVSAARFEADESDDAFLAELRRAMADEEPLGPRAGEAGSEDDDGGRRPRFGRRR